MNRSIIDRIFPHSSGPLLPQHNQTEPLTRGQSHSPVSSPRIYMHDDVPMTLSSTLEQYVSRRSDSRTSSSPQSTRRSLQSAPLSASVLHHDDPFLPVERAARALQESIQDLLDAQSRALSGRAADVERPDTISTGSRTPTQSVTVPRLSSSMRTVPIRQPVKKSVSLRGARKGLSRKMQEFAELRAEELRVLEAETDAREKALGRVKELKEKKSACTAEIEAIRQEDTVARAATLRTEANNVQFEIEQLEHKLLELRVRQRYLVSQADQLESTQESKISSFEGTINMIDRETRAFLRRPPITHALAIDLMPPRSGMYVLKPERRTLEMAKELWTSEQQFLAQRKSEVEHEHTALIEGEQLWSKAAKRISLFEQELRTQTTRLTEETAKDHRVSMDHVLNKLNQTITSLESDLIVAESKGWNLLVCAIGAELEAFHQAHDLLEQTQQIGNDNLGPRSGTGYSSNILQAPPTTTIRHKTGSPHGSTGSNQSLKDTLHEFSQNLTSPKQSAVNSATKYESEDDEPPDDFLLSR